MFLLYKVSFRKLLLPVLFFSGIVSLYLNYKFASGTPTRLSVWLPYLAESLSDGKSTLFFLIFFRVFEFAIGGILLWVVNFKLPSRFLYDILLWTGLVLVLYAVFKFNDAMLFPYWYALAPCIGAALVIYSGGKAYTSRIINNKAFIAVGLLSYSLYLVHWPVIVFWHYLGDTFGLTQQVLVVFISFALATFLYNFIEQPLRFKHILSKGYAWKGVGIGFTVLLLAGLHSYTYQGWEWRIGEPIVNFEELDNSEEFHKKYYGGAGYPSYGAVKTELPPDLIILGDSHGRHYAEGLYKVIAEPNDLAFYVASGTSCFHLPNFTRTTDGHDWDKNCPQRLEKAFSYIKSAPKPPLVIISHSWNSQMSRADLLDSKGKRRGIKVTTDELIEGLTQLKERLGDAELLVIGNVPRAGSNLYDIFTRPRPLFFSGFNPESYLFRNREPALEETNKALKSYAEETGLYTFIDPFDYLCDSEKCRNTDEENRLIYSDAGHMSKYGSVFLIDQIKDTINSLVQ